MKAPNEITAAQARDAFKRRASLFLLQETVAIRSAFSKKKNRSTFAGVHLYQSRRAIYIVFIAAYSRRIVLLCVGYN